MVTALPDYREAYFDLAQAYYWKMQGQGDDPALRGKALQVYRKLMELEHENPRLPAENLSFLQDLYGPVIDFVPGGS